MDEQFKSIRSLLTIMTSHLPCTDEGSSNHKPKTKRVRTTFTEDQIQVLQANFQMDSNPDGQDLERIAQITGLSKRVTQVSAIRVVLQQKLHHPISLHIVYSTKRKICFCS